MSAQNATNWPVVLREFIQREQESGISDPLLVDALAAVGRAGYASVFVVHRDLDISYTRAGRLIGLMREHGVVAQPESWSNGESAAEFKLADVDTVRGLLFADAAATTGAAVHELWRVAYSAQAYTDQTGKSQPGHLVYEQLLVRETDRFDQEDGYTPKTYEGVGIIAVDAAGREFRGTANLVDYCGGRSWRCMVEREPGFEEIGHWIAAPRSVAGYCHPDGSAPVASVREGER